MNKGRDVNRSRDLDKYQKYHRPDLLKSVGSMTATEVVVAEHEIRMKAPVRHCWWCGKVLKKRSYRVNSENELKFYLVAYGWRDSGFWCSPVCIANHAPQLGSTMAKISRSSIFTNDGYDLSKRSINYKREVFPA